MPSLQLQHPIVNPHHRFHSSLSEGSFGNNTQGHGRAVMKSFSLPHLNGYEANHNTVNALHQMHRANDIQPFAHTAVNGRTTIEQDLRKKPTAAVAIESNLLPVATEPQSCILPTHVLTADFNSKFDQSGKRNGLRLPTGNGLTYMSLSPEYVKYETYRNSHNKVFERVTKTLRTSSSLSDDTNRISKSLSMAPNHLGSPHSHSVPSSPSKNGEGSRSVSYAPEKNFAPVATKHNVASQVLTFSPTTDHTHVVNSFTNQNCLKGIRSFDFRATTETPNSPIHRNRIHYINGRSNGTPFTPNGFHKIPGAGNGLCATAQHLTANGIHNNDNKIPDSPSITLSPKVLTNGNGVRQSIELAARHQNGWHPNGANRKSSNHQMDIDENMKRVTKKRPNNDSSIYSPSKVKRVSDTVIQRTENGRKMVNLSNMLSDIYKGRLLVNSGMAARIDETRCGTFPRNRPKSC